MHKDIHRKICALTYTHTVDYLWINRTILPDACARKVHFFLKPFILGLFQSSTLIHLFTFLSTSPCLRENYKHIYPHYVDNFIFVHV